MESPKNFSFDENKIETSTPFLKSEFAQKLLKKYFIKNLHREVSMDSSSFEEKFINMKITNRSPLNRKNKPFIFTDKKFCNDYRFHIPESISTSTIEKYQEIFEEGPRVKRNCIRF
jgi:hypothetical protein